MLSSPGGNQIRTVSILANMVFFVVAFNYSFFNSLFKPLVAESLTLQYGAAYAAANIGKYATAFAAAIHICGTIANPVFGQISDRLGRRPVVLASLSSATLWLLCFATVRVYWLLLAARIVTGLFDSSQFVAKVVLGDVATPETQKKLFSQLYAWFALCLVVGPVLVSVFPASAAITGPCLVAASIALVCFVACLAYLPETKPPPLDKEAGVERGSSMAWYQVLSKAELAVPVWLYGLLSMCLAAGETCTALYITETRGGLALTNADTGLLFAVQGVAYGLTQALVSSPLLKRYGNTVMFRATLAALTLLYPLTVVAAHTPFRFWTLAPVMLARGFATSMAVSSINLIINECGSRAGALGSVAAVGQSICGLTKAIVLCSFGVLYDILASRHAVYMAFVVIGVMTALLLASSYALRPAAPIGAAAGGMLPRRVSGPPIRTCK